MFEMMQMLKLCFLGAWFNLYLTKAGQKKKEEMKLL